MCIAENYDVTNSVTRDTYSPRSFMHNDVSDDVNFQNANTECNKDRKCYSYLLTASLNGNVKENVVYLKMYICEDLER